MGEHRLAWFDVSAGAAGDMVCGALVDAGAPLQVLQDATDAVVPGAVRWYEEPVVRGGLRACSVHPRVVEQGSPDRTWAHVRSRLEAADLDGAVRTDAIAVFARLAQAEARVHGTPVTDVHFHEVGGLDAIADVVGACAALRHLGVAEVTGGHLAVGSGRVRTAHGELPVPVPAVLELTRGWEIEAGGHGESATPTGAALITGLATRCVPLPAMTCETSGVGAGSRETAGRPNVVRVVIGSTWSESSDAAVMTEIVLQANVDDLDPRLWPTVLEALLAGGASDAWLQPIVMKKGRPAHTLSVLAPPHLAADLRAIVFATTSTIGLREHAVGKRALDRRIVEVTVHGRPVRVKVAVDEGRIVHATPEFDDVAALARTIGRTPREVLETAVAAVATAGLVPGDPAA